MPGARGEPQHAALVAATLFVSLTSLRLYEEAIPRLFQPAATSYQSLELAAGVVVVSMVVAGLPLIKLYAQKQRGAAAKAQLTESINDELGLLAALVGTSFIALGWPIADPVASVVATIIAYNGVKLLLENLSLLLGRSPGPEYLARVESLARSVPGVIDVRDLRVELIGPDTVHAGMRVGVPPRTSVEEANRIVVEIHHRVHQGTDAAYCFIQVGPAEPPIAAAPPEGTATTRA